MTFDNQLIIKSKKILQEKLQNDGSKKYLVIQASKQKIYLVEKGKICFESFVSTSKYGLGNEDGSFKTPLGIHAISEKIGETLPKYTVFKARKPTNLKCDLTKNFDDDLIISRIIRLIGLEKNINLGGNVDTHSRHVYIHGTPHEVDIGTPVSHGCIRMKNDEIINLFQKVDTGTLVIIVDY